MREMYFLQARLLLHILECLEYETSTGEPLFALKGGTALNFFVQPFPRLSVDIDLTYCPLDGRDAALAAMRESLQRLFYPRQRCLTLVPNSRDRRISSAGRSFGK